MLSNQIEKINEELKPIREEVILCDDILKRSKEIEEKLSQAEKEQGKEDKNNEHIR